MKDIGSALGVKNISDLVLKEICGICGENNLTKEKINNYKMTEKELYKNFSNLSEDESNTKSNRKYLR